LSAAAAFERVAVPHERPRKPPRLEACGITKRFGALTVLDGVGLRLAPGDFHALLGGNGAGKSTLVKCIMGYYRADAGSVLIDDREVEIATPREALRLGLGMVYQHFTLVPSMSVLENLVLARAEIPMVLHWRREERELATLMARMPFRVDLGAPVHSLSAGEKQKVEILKQLFLERRIVILDEPTSLLTPYESDEVPARGAHRGALRRQRATRAPRGRSGCSSPPTPASASTSPRRSAQRSWRPVTAAQRSC